MALGVLIGILVVILKNMKMLIGYLLAVRLSFSFGFA